MNRQSPLVTDLYQLTMMQAYYLDGNNDAAVFECYIRNQAAARNFYIAMGLGDVLNYLSTLHFEKAELDYLASTQLFQAEFLDYLADFRFTGDVFAIEEGEVCFAKEPILSVHAPIIEAQLIESRLINLLHYQTLIASKAVRCVIEADSAHLFDFGLRRSHGQEAAMMAARACYAVGFDGTATVSAGMQDGIPIIGTMAHAFILAYPDEYAAFKAYAKAHPEKIVLLIDTYDTLTGVDNVIRLAREEGVDIKGVRIDSGDLGELARQVRVRLDKAGLTATKIFVSGNVDEYKIASLKNERAPIDGYGVGTRLVTSEDCPSLDMVYKLQHYASRDTMKFSPGKVSLPGVKQVIRRFDAQGKIQTDTIALADETQSGTALLKPVMRNGQALQAADSLETIRERVQNRLGALPERILGLESATMEAILSDALAQLLAELQAAAGH